MASLDQLSSKCAGGDVSGTAHKARRARRRQHAFAHHRTAEGSKCASTSRLRCTVSGHPQTRMRIWAPLRMRESRPVRLRTAAADREKASASHENGHEPVGQQHPI